MLMFFVTSLIPGCNIHHSVSYNTIKLPYVLTKQNVWKGKVYIYAFHLRKGGVI